MDYSRCAGGVLAIVLAVSCGGGASGTGPSGPGNNGTPSGGNTSITVTDDYYTPQTTRVGVGASVTWTWTGSNNHSVTFDDGTTSPTQASGTYTRNFSLAGTYNYHCKVHGVAMSASVTVQ